MQLESIMSQGDGNDEIFKIKDFEFCHCKDTNVKKNKKNFQKKNLF